MSQLLQIASVFLMSISHANDDDVVVLVVVVVVVVVVQQYSEFVYIVN